MQELNAASMPMIGDKAPAFHAVTTQGIINFPQDYLGRWVIFFSHPADFTPVCTTEFMTFAFMTNEFKTLGTDLIGLSTGSIYSHIAWLRKIKELSWKNIKHVEINFPLIADNTMEIAEKYCMLHLEYSRTQTVRATYIIDPEGFIRSIQYYPASTGRNIQELKRLIVSLQKADRERVSTPAEWQPGEDVILSPPGTWKAAMERFEKVEEDVYCLDWFLCFKQSGYEPGSIETEPEYNPYPSSYPGKK